MRLLFQVLIIVFLGSSALAEPSTSPGDPGKTEATCWAQVLLNAKRYKSETRKILKKIDAQVAKSNDGDGNGPGQRHYYAQILLNAITSLQKTRDGSKLDENEKEALSYLCEAHFVIEDAISP